MLLGKHQLEANWQRTWEYWKKRKIFLRMQLVFGKPGTKMPKLQAGCRTVSNNCSGSGLAPAQNILAVQVWFGFT